MISIIYEDDYIMAVNKPSGILVIPAPESTGKTLTDHIDDILEKRGVRTKSHPCHRIDRETSGVILYAKGKKMQKDMMQLFHDNKVKKKYLAVASGYIKKNEGEIKSPISGKAAVTIYKIIKRTEDYTVVEVQILTGRTNQIRIHMKSIGHPLIGESKFAFRKDFKIKMKRVALHSMSVEFPHPVTGENLKLEAPIPSDMKKFTD